MNHFLWGPIQCVCVRWRVKGEGVFPSPYIHTYTHTHIHTYIHTYIHFFLHTYIHTYTYTYIHVFLFGVLYNTYPKCPSSPLFTLKQILKSSLLNKNHTFSPAFEAKGFVMVDQFLNSYFAMRNAKCTIHN